jgi:HKD family nuclease
MLVDIGQPISRRIVSSTSHGLALLLKVLHELENQKVYAEVLPSNIIGQRIVSSTSHGLALLLKELHELENQKVYTQVLPSNIGYTWCHSSLALQLDRETK